MIPGAFVRFVGQRCAAGTAGARQDAKVLRRWSLRHTSEPGCRGMSAVAFSLHSCHTVIAIVGVDQHALHAELQASTRRAGPSQEGVEGRETAGAKGTSRDP